MDIKASIVKLANCNQNYQFIKPKDVLQYVNCKLPDVQAGFRKGRGTRDQISTSSASWKKQESSRKIFISVLLTNL